VRVTFYPRWRSTVSLARSCGITGSAGVLLSTLPGRLAWVAYLRRRVPGRALRVRLLSRREPLRTISGPHGRGRPEVRGAAVVVAGPCEQASLTELIESIRHHEGDDIKIVVADDATGEYPDALVRLRFPGVDFVRARIPGGNASCSFRTQQLAFLHLLEHYDTPVILKVDPDALMIGRDAFASARARFEKDPALGVLGTTHRDASGAETDYRFSTWMLHPELRWSRRLRSLLAAAQRGVGTVDFAQGGAYFISTAALRSARDRGLLPFAQPAWSLLTEDVITDLVIQAAGFRVGSFGAPGEPIASNTRALPLEPQQAAERGFKIVHSVRASPAGLSEQAVRAFFRERRAQGAPSSGAPIGSAPPGGD
jgi:hypothetical protein